MDKIILAILIVLLSGLALHDIVRFIRSLEGGALWKVALGICLPCVLAACLMIGLGVWDSAPVAAPFSRAAAIERY